MVRLLYIKEKPDRTQGQTTVGEVICCSFEQQIDWGVVRTGDNVYVKGSVCDLLMTKYCDVCP